MSAEEAKNTELLMIYKTKFAILGPFLYNASISINFVISVKITELIFIKMSLFSNKK